jgi:hypothetical protein
LDIASEGPFSKNYNGSYLINYRYSTLAAISRMIDIGDAQTDFQDLSFNVYLPTKRAGQFTIFGFGGLSSQRYKASADSSVWEDEGERYNSDFTANTMAAGVTHSINIGKNSYLKTVLVGSYFGNDFKATRLNDEYQNEDRERGHTYQDRQLLSSVFNHKFNARNSLRAGIILSRLGFNIRESSYDSDTDALEQVLKVRDYTYTFQQFINWQHRLNEKLTLQAGVHALQLALNSDLSIEPRASLSYALNDKNSFTLGYGLHSQMQPLGVYFGESLDLNGNSVRQNENLGLSRSHHFVVGYDRMLNAWTHVKIESYYQHLFRIPVSIDPEENFSMQNLLGGYYTEALSNDGRGRNYGAELTLEQFMRNDFYFLLSGSLYDSRYRDREGVWRNTRFNGNYACTFTAGKEWKSGPKLRNRIFGANVKLVYAGGLRATPINLEESLEKGETVYVEEQAFTLQNPAYFRTDIRISMKRNRPSATHQLSLDIQNVTSRRNIFGEAFNPLTGKIKTYYQAPLIPVLSYRVEF